MSQTQMEFVLAQFRTVSPVKASQFIAAMSDTAIRHDAQMEQLMGTLVLIYHTPELSEKEFNRSRLVDEAQALLPHDSRIVHGVAPGFLGNLGNETRMFYAATFLGCDFAIARVFEMDAGRVEELTA
ncbi:MAG: hypothetical protein ACPGVU_13535 [Limisphaerales bacterium]